MAIHKVGYLALLLLFGLTLVASNVEHLDPVKPCPLYCDLRIQYKICDNAPADKIYVGCTNCCFLEEGCKFYSGDGNFICEGEPEVISKVDNDPPKGCPKNCDPRIAFGICPRAGNKMINLNQICTNCCAGKKGCSYFSADGSFVCKGESEYVSARGNNFLKSKVAMS